jgi:transposase InsO family protein
MQGESLDPRCKADSRLVRQRAWTTRCGIMRKWLADTGVKTLYIEPGSPWENGYCESFNSKLGDEFLNGEIFYSLKEVQGLAERWRVHYNTIRPHSSLGYRSPAPETWAIQTNHAPSGSSLDTSKAALH